MNKFIYCKDKDIAKKLESSFKLITNKNGMYIFLNNDKLNFEGIDKTKISYGDKLYF